MESGLVTSIDVLGEKWLPVISSVEHMLEDIKVILIHIFIDSFAMEGLERVCSVSLDMICMAFEEPINPVQPYACFGEYTTKPCLTDLVNVSLDTCFLKWPPS